MITVKFIAYCEDFKMTNTTWIWVPVLFSAVYLTIYAYFKYAYTYWSRRKVPYIKPTFPLGNIPTIMPKGISFGTVSKPFYDQLKNQGQKFGGIYSILQPYLVIVDPSYVRDILAKDFQCFVDRGIYLSRKDPISVNILAQSGDEWKNTRVKFTPTFTSGKMKHMFNAVTQNSKHMINALEKLANQNADIDMLEIASCFTTDVIGNVIFGLDCNCFDDPDAAFRVIGRSLFNDFDLWMQINLFLSIRMPNLARKLGVRNIQKPVSDYFFKILQETVQYREENNIKRADFLQMLIDLKNQEDETNGISFGELVAQAFLFYNAGFETSSKTITFTLFELSKNQEVQGRVRQEIVDVLGRHNNELSYDSLHEMKYLGQIVDETLRIWPPVTTLTRICTKDYKLRDTDIIIKKDTGIMISTLGMHHDPEYFANPEKFDPERFNEENVKGIHPFVYLPFGEGPRNCIGLRFGKMQTKIGLATILKNFNVSLSEKTKLPLGLDPDTFVIKTMNTIYLNMKKI